MRNEISLMGRLLRALIPLASTKTQRHAIVPALVVAEYARVHTRQLCLCSRTSTRRQAFSPCHAGDPETQPPKKAKREPPTIVGKTSCIRPLDEVWQNAAVLIDKDKSWTSHDVVSKLRGMLRMKKIGHAGTLDPNATGLLILCTGKGTKALESFVAQEKEYSGAMQLGGSTPSYDAETEIDRSLPWEHVTDEDLKRAAQHFTGDQMQLPPMYSALKVNGERLYFAARRGQVVERKPRSISISALTLERNPDAKQEVNFRVTCSKGTYVRSLVHDVGAFLGTAAFMSSLCRERIGEYSVTDAWNIHDLDAALKRPPVDQ